MLRLVFLDKNGNVWIMVKQIIFETCCLLSLLVFLSSGLLQKRQSFSIPIRAKLELFLYLTLITRFLPNFRPYLVLDRQKFLGKRLWRTRIFENQNGR